MAVEQSTTPSIVELGEAIYERKLRARLESDNKGKYLLIHVDTEDFVLDKDQLVAAQQAMALHSDGRWYMLRIGYPGATRIGWFPQDDD